jgi:Mn-dependent DtxR family transcriptional regulator
LVEDFGSRRLVHGKLSIEGELLVLLHSHYPAYVSVDAIMSSLNRRNEGSVTNTLREMWRRKLVEGSKKEGYRLTQPGFNAALGIIREALSKQP